MFQIDNEFLAEIGLGDMPDDQKDVFKAHIQEELETRVGARMSEGLSDDQIAEFERIIDGDDETINAIIGTNYRQDQLYNLLIKRAGFVAGSKELNSEYASVKWLTKNRPDYQQIVAEVADKLKKEITENKNTILGSAA